MSLQVSSRANEAKAEVMGNGEPGDDVLNCSSANICYPLLSEDHSNVLIFFSPFLQPIYSTPAVVFYLPGK